MHVKTYAGNSLRDIENFINGNGITKDQIVNIMSHSDGTFTIMYYEED